jgi:hypothetical protein
MKYLPLLITLIAGTAYGAEETQGHISANVVDAATITQSDDGSVTVSAVIPPLYCTADSTGTICYY